MCMTMAVEATIHRNPSDRIVYKVLAPISHLSPFRMKHYKPNMTYRLKNPLYESRRTIHAGFHSLTSLSDAMSYIVHTDSLARGQAYEIVQMVIPKGAMIAEGTYGAIVSSSIRTGEMVSMGTIETAY